MSAMGPTAVPGIPSRPLCRIQQLSILFPSWRRALRQVPNGSPANLKSATSRTPKPCPRGIKTPCSSKKICFFKTCAATETNLDKVQKSHLRPPPNRPLSVPLSLPPTAPPFMVGLPARHAPAAAQHFQPAHCKSKAVFVGPALCLSVLWPPSRILQALGGHQLQLCMSCGAFHKNIHVF